MSNRLRRKSHPETAVAAPPAASVARNSPQPEAIQKQYPRRYSVFALLGILCLALLVALFSMWMILHHR